MRMIMQDKSQNQSSILAFYKFNISSNDWKQQQLNVY